MGWFEKLRKSKEPSKPQPKTHSQAGQVVAPVCSKCESEIVCLNVSIGKAIEEQGACLYSGSEGHLYEPMYDGVICTSCKYMLCDTCQSELTNEAQCPQCGGTMRQIIHHRLPKAP